jgi:hypothetical protein
MYSASEMNTAMANASPSIFTKVKDLYLTRFLNAVLKKLFHMMINLVITGQMTCHFFKPFDNELITKHIQKKLP